jgi:4-amino-4-deoxy-L-arabinose transferase-like glycosyltransferase
VTRIRRAWRALEPHVATGRGTAAVFCASLVIFGLASIAWPVVEGRDYVTYMRFYAEMWGWHSVIPWEMLWRLPVAPAALGIPLDLGGPWLARLWIAILFATTVTVWFRVALRFGAAAAVGLVVALLAYPSFVALFHRYSSDAITGVVVALLALALARAYERPTTSRWALVGAGVAAIALTRPANQVLVLLCLVPLALGGTWRARLLRAGACALIAVVPLVAWAGANAARYDDFTISRGGGGWLPFYRAYLTDDLVRPDNGPASRELADLVRRELVTREPYVSYGIGVDDVFGDPQTRYHEDLISLSDRFWGWDSDYAKLRKAALEGVRRHPFTYVGGVARSGVTQLWQAFVLAPLSGGDDDGGSKTVSVAGQELPRPSEGQPIPAASRSYWLSRPDNAFDEVWTSPTEHHVVSTRPELLRELERMDAKVDGLRLSPGWTGWGDGARGLNRLTRLYPPPLLWLVVGLLAIVWRRPARAGLALVLAASTLAVLLATLVSVPPVPEFVLPLFPALVLLAMAGLLGRRRDARTR